jgi:hypothetical protein
VVLYVLIAVAPSMVAEIGVLALPLRVEAMLLTCQTAGLRTCGAVLEEPASRFFACRDCPC